MNDKRLFVEQRPEGDYAVRKGNSQRASPSYSSNIP